MIQAGKGKALYENFDHMALRRDAMQNTHACSALIQDKQFANSKHAVSHFYRPISWVGHGRVCGCDEREKLESKSEQEKGDNRLETQQPIINSLKT